MTDRRLSRGAGRRAAAALAVLLAATLLASGCWDRVELPDLDLITGAAFDAASNGGVRLTLSLALPQNLPGPSGPGGGGAGSGGGQPTIVASASGATIGKAIDALGQGMPGQLFWGHTRIILVGAGLARRSIQPVLDFFMRQRTTRLSTYILVTPGEAAPLLKVAPPYRVPATDVIFEHLRLGTEPVATVYAIAQSLLTVSGGALVPEVGAGRPAPPGGEPPGAAGGSGGNSTTSTPESFLFDGAGIFEHGRLRGVLGPPAMRGALWLLGETRHSTVVLHAPHGVVLTAELEAVRTHRQGRILPGGGPGIGVTIDANYTVTQVEAGQPPLRDPQYLLLLARLLDTTIRRSAGQALAAARVDDVDFLHFGRLLAADQPAAWRGLYGDWPAVFPRLPVTLDVRAHVRAAGNLVTLR